VKTSPNTTEWTSDGNYAVVVVKSSTLYAMHVNVTTGQVLKTPGENYTGNPQDISHVSRFVCEE
jgi:multidrug efflux pump subunit AcrA (membrane-fusion protein)